MKRRASRSLIALGGIHVGCGRARLDQIDRDIARHQFPGEPKGERDLRRLGRRIDSDARRHDAAGERRSDEDDPSAPAEMGDRGADIDRKQRVEQRPGRMLCLRSAYLTLKLNVLPSLPVADHVTL